VNEGAAVTSDLTITVERGEVLRLLGYRRAEQSEQRNGRRRSEACLDSLWNDALALVQARGAWRVVDAAAAGAAGMPEPAAESAPEPGFEPGPRPAPLVGIGVCTIGPRLETESAARAAAGSLLEALVLDAIGSAAAEAAADEVNLALCADAHSRGLFAAARVSPGYGSWEMAAQERLLALLPYEVLGIALTSGQMMMPRKSVSFAARFTTEPAPGSARPCARCGLIRCRHRKEDP